MTARIGPWMAIGLLAAVAPAAAQTQYRQPSYPPQQAVRQRQRPAAQAQHQPGQPPYRMAERPDQVARPPYRGASRYPTVHRRTPPKQVAAAPFTLTPREEAQLDLMLRRWEQHAGGVKTFECKFTRFDWDLVFGQPDQPAHVVRGEVKYAAPDKGMFRVDGELVNYRWVNNQAVGGQWVKGQRAEHWICNGKSVFEYNFQNTQLIEHELPPELQGQEISEGPLPFLFGAKADRLKQRYFMRIVTPAGVQGQVWLEAYPRLQPDAANYRKATLILTFDDMQPFALEIVMPSEKQWERYCFQKPKVNAKNLLDPLGVFDNNWLYPRTPAGWTKIVEPAPAAQAGRPPAAGARR